MPELSLSERHLPYLSDYVSSRSELTDTQPAFSIQNFISFRNINLGQFKSLLSNLSFCAYLLVMFSLSFMGFSLLIYVFILISRLKKKDFESPSSSELSSCESSYINLYPGPSHTRLVPKRPMPPKKCSSLK